MSSILYIFFVKILTTIIYLQYWLFYDTIIANCWEMKMREKYLPFEDVVELFSKIYIIHPQMFVHITPFQFEKQLNKSSKNWENLTINEKYYEIMRLNALIGDLHTSIEIGGKNYPIKMQKCREGVFITKIRDGECDENLLYSKVLEINNIPIEEIIEMAKPIVASESEEALESRILNKLNNSNFLQILGVADQEKIEVSVLEGDEVKNVTLSSKVHIVEKYPLEGTNFDINIQDDYVYVKINRFRDQQGNMLSKIHAEVERAFESGKPVIFDVRNNPGGNTRLFTPLCDGLREEKGKAFCLVNGNSASASVLFANAVREAGGTLVGETMSQSATFHANAKSIETINGLGAKVSTSLTVEDKKTYRTSIIPMSVDYYQDAIKPDVEIVPSIEDLKNGKDEALDYCLNEIDKMDKTSKEEFEETELVF